MNRVTTFTLTEADLLAAGRRYVFFSLTERKTAMRLVMIWLAALGISFAMLWFLGSGQFSVPAALGLATLIATTGAFVVPAAVPLITLPIVTRRRLKQDAMLRRVLNASWTDTHYRVETDDTINNLAFADYAKWLEDEKQILFFLSDYNYQILPKRVLTSAQVADIVAVVKAARGEQQGA